MWWQLDSDRVRKGIAVENNQQMLEYIVKCIQDTGCDPRVQIKGYVDSGNERYITRYGDARNLIKSVDPSLLEHYVTGRSA